MVPTFKALNADVGTEPDYPPLRAAAGVLLLETDHITQFYLHNHCFTLKVIWLWGGSGQKIVNLFLQ